MTFKYSAASEKGLRPYQEDTSVVYWVPDEGYLLAVFDGHGGGKVSKLCADRLVAIWHEVRNKLLVVNFEALMLGVFAKLNSETESYGAGSTASIVFIPASGEEVIVGILGDSPVLVQKADGELWLSPEHNIRSNAAEAMKAERRGGFISNGYLFAHFSGGGLQMSRALGDRNLASVLLREPEIFRIPLGETSFVLVASDGVFDPGHASNPSQAIADKIKNGADAKDLVDAALAVPTHDNATAVLVRISNENTEIRRTGNQ
jgi:serine/threonine protein phosphatase PrpC